MLDPGGPRAARVSLRGMAVAGAGACRARQCSRSRCVACRGGARGRSAVVPVGGAGRRRLDHGNVIGLVLGADRIFTPQQEEAEAARCSAVRSIRRALAHSHRRARCAGCDARARPRHVGGRCRTPAFARAGPDARGYGARAGRHGVRFPKTGTHWRRPRCPAAIRATLRPLAMCICRRSSLWHACATVPRPSCPKP